MRPGADGTQQQKRTADRAAALRMKPSTCESWSPEPARHLTGCEAMKQQEGMVIKRVQVTEVEEGVRGKDNARDGEEVKERKVIQFIGEAEAEQMCVIL